MLPSSTLWSLRGSNVEQQGRLVVGLVTLRSLEGDTAIGKAGYSFGFAYTNLRGRRRLLSCKGVRVLRQNFERRRIDVSAVMTWRS